MKAQAARRLSCFGLLASASALVACSLVRDLDELEMRAPPGADAGAGDSAPMTEAGDAGDAGDAGACPSDMVEQRVAGGARFCIERTEVTQDAYERFLAVKDVATPTGCESNTSYRPDEPEPDGGRCDTSFDPKGKPKLPVVCVDHCDATAYCAWRGRRLCSAPGGGRLEASSVNDPALDEWFVACAGASNPRAYSSGATPGQCVHDRSSAEPAGSAGCATPEGVLHLSGNVNEWTDICNAGRASCLVRGGAFPGTEAALACLHTGVGDTGPKARTARSVFTGFRCCKDP
ncbi:MAG: SUMF1/EgtB/PvdO family nonheme iron enzyme [Deltaproteobacteria bacterium]|nr:SUMF1/EgtB/PvdO family nonheme iron enzyme [Deltaproteobacteria bacterium]